MPFALINDISGTWSFGGHFCKLWIATDVMSSTASIANLLAISLDRFVEELKRSWKSLSVNNGKTSSGLDYEGTTVVHAQSGSLLVQLY